MGGIKNFNMANSSISTEISMHNNLTCFVIDTKLIILLFCCIYVVYFVFIGTRLIENLQNDNLIITLNILVWSIYRTCMYAKQIKYRFYKIIMFLFCKLRTIHYKLIDFSFKKLNLLTLLLKIETETLILVSTSQV